MDYLVICLTAFLAAALTLFSGFGLGTLLLPAFALFFPVEIAVSATAVVHLLNNLFKLLLVGRKANLRVVMAFGAPAVLSSIAGAWLLTRLAVVPALAEYALGGRTYRITAIKLAMAVLILLFSMADLVPERNRLSFDARWIPLGGALSGLFGGLSGHQGALRSAFLINSGLSKEAFIGTGVACAVLVDLARLLVYGASFGSEHGALLATGSGYTLVAAAALTAFAGSLLGVLLSKRVTFRALRGIVAAFLALFAIALAAGLV